MNTIFKLAPGFILCFILAGLAWFMGQWIPVVGGAVFTIIFGMAVALKRPTARMDAGIRFTSKTLLQYSIVLLGLEMNMRNILEVGGQSLWVMAFTLTAAFVTAFVASKLLRLPKDTSVLIAVGTSICGGSAIAATALVINAKDEDVAQAISTIFLFNIVAVFLFPPLGQALGLSDTGFGMWAGTAVNDTSSVVAAGSAWSQRVGNDAALHFATIVKLTRTLMIVPLTLILALYTSRKAKAENNDFSLVKVFPLFVLGFVAASLIDTFLPMPESLARGLVTVGKFMIVMAMAAIGLNTNLKKLLNSGLNSILLGLYCWGAVATVSLLVQMASGKM